MLADGSGGYYVAGSFGHIGDATRSNVAHILSDGSVDPAFNASTDATVYCLTKDASNLYLGGGFNNVNGTPRGYGGAVNLTTGALQAWNPSADWYIYTMAHSAGRIFMGGGFTTIKGSSRNYAAAVTTGNVLSSWAPNANNYVRQLVVNATGTFVYLGGDFTTIKGSTRNYLGKVDVNTGNLVAAWNPAPNSSVNALYLNGNILYAGGSFTTIKTTFNRVFFGAMDTASATPTPLIADADSYINCINQSGNKLYIGGYFTTINSNARPHVARIDIPSATLDSWSPSIGGNVYAINFSGSNIVTGGDFTYVNGIDKNHVAVIDATTQTVGSWTPTATISGTVGKMLKSGTDLFLGGSFNYQDGANFIYNIMSVNTTTGNLSHNFVQHPNSTVTDLAIANGRLMASGSFSNLYDVNTSTNIDRKYLADYNMSTYQLSSNIYDPENYSGGFQQGNMLTDATGNLIVINNAHWWNLVNRNYIAALDINTGLPTAWDAASNSPVWTMALKDSLLFVGGTFTNIGGQSRLFLAAISTATGLAKSWNANTDNYVNSLAVQDTTLYVGGTFTTIKGSARNNAAAVSVTGTGTVRTWNPAPNGNVVAIQPLPSSSGGDIYLGGQFTTVKGSSRNFLARVNNTTGNLINSFNPNPNSYVYAFALDTSTSVLYVGGNNMTSISGQSRFGLAAYNTSNNTLRPFNPSTVAFTNNGGYTTGLALFGKELYIAADYQDSIKGLARGRLAAVDTGTSNPTTFDPMPDNYAKMVRTGSNKLFAGGSWSNIGSNYAPAYFAVYTLQPQTPPSNLIFTSLLPQSVTASWTNGSGEARLAVVKQGGAPTVPTDGKSYTANAAYKSGQTTGTSSYAVANGSGNNVNVTNLLPNHSYTFSIFEYNGTGTATDYLQTPLLTGSITTPCPTYSFGIDSSGPLTMCGGSVTLTAPAGFSTYAWSPSGTTQSIIASTSGTYSVNYTDSNGCSGNASVVVTVKPVPPTSSINASPSPSTNLCPGTTATLTATLATTYLWNTGATTRTITTGVAGSFTVTVFNSQGCGKTSAARTVSFRTCGRPTVVGADNVTASSATIRWRPVPCAIGYRIQYRKGTTGTFTIVTTTNTDTFLVINSLMANSQYQWRVATVCLNTPFTISSYTALTNFTTAPSFARNNPTQFIETNEMMATAKVYPNPANTNAMVAFTATKAGAFTLQLTDAAGKVMMMKKGIAIAGENRVSIDVSAYAKGMYMINILNEGSGNETLKLVKK